MTRFKRTELNCGEYSVSDSSVS